MKESKGGGRKVEGEGGQMEMEERLRREPEAQAVPACGGWFYNGIGLKLIRRYCPAMSTI